MAHAPFAPSGFKRVMLCPGSHQAEKKYQDPPKEYAAEGTFAHDIRDTALKEGLNAEDFVGTYCEVEGFGFFWGMADAHMLQPGIDRIRDVGAEWHFEKRVNMERWIKDCWGTLDAGGILPDLIIIDDLKWGRGVRVSANRNIQMMLYALGFWDQVARHKTKARRFLLRIDQPRIPGGTNEWYTSLDELLAFAQEAIEAAELSLSENPPFAASLEACTFCKVGAASECGYLDNMVLELLGIDPELLAMGVFKMADLKKLNGDQRQVLLENSMLIKNWLSGIYFNSLEKAISGEEETPGYKPVETIGDRTWVDEAEAEKFLLGKLPAHKAYNRKILSPAQAENVLGTRNWKQAQDLIHRPPGKPALVPLSDPRPALIPVVELFEDLDSEDPDIESMI